ncbi:MAG: hypothetical protein AB1410_03285 [Acidobacteriota bacterium]
MKYLKTLLMILFLILIISCSQNSTETNHREKEASEQILSRIIKKIEKKEALEIVKLSLKAKGIDKLDRFKDLTIYYYREIPKSPDGSKKINLTLFYKFPDKIRMDTEVYFVAKNTKALVSEVYDGVSSWMSENNIIKDVSEGKEKELKGLASISSLKGPLYLLSIGEYEFDEAYEEKNEGRYYVIKMHSKGGEKRNFNIYIDTNSYLPIIEEVAVPKLMGFTEVRLKNYILNYINLEGFMLQGKTKRSSSIGPFKEEMETIVIKVEVNTNLSDSLFQKPKSK